VAVNNVLHCCTVRGGLMKLFYASGSSSLLPHIVLLEAGLAFTAIQIDEHTTKSSKAAATTER
jgi:hypothetical protein